MRYMRSTGVPTVSELAVVERTKQFESGAIDRHELYPEYIEQRYSLHYGK